MSGMSSFLNAIPEAATSPYALAAYAIAAIIFLIAGAKLMTTSMLVKTLSLLAEKDRPAALEKIIGDPLPPDISPAQWIRNNRIKWSFLLAGSVVIVALVVAIVALNLMRNPSTTEVENIVKKQAAESDRRHMTPLEDAQLYAIVNLDANIPSLAEYIRWVESAYKAVLVRGNCYDLTDNPLKIEMEMPPGMPTTGLVCDGDHVITFSPSSPLFPTIDRNGSVATEVLARLRADVEFFNGAPIVEEYGANERRGVLLMRYDSNAESEKSVPRSIRVGVHISKRQLSLRAAGFKYAKSSWVRDQNVNSLVDLAGKQMVFWVQVGKKEFAGDELGLTRKSTSLDHFYLNVGGLKIAPDPSKWRPIKDRFGSPAWVYDMPRTPEELLAMLR